MEDSRYTLKLTPMAENDLERIFEYIAKTLLASQAAFALMDDIEQQIMRLRDFPYSGSPVLDELLSSKGYRKVIVHNYLAFYLVNEAEKQVVITRVLYGAQKYDSIL